MAKFNCVGLRELERRMASRAALVDDAAPEMLKAGTDVLVKYQKKSVAECLHKVKGKQKAGLVETGDMLESIKSGPIKDGKDGYYQEVWPQGKDRKGTRNATKGFVLNYGTSDIDATHWMELANDEAHEEVVEAMRKVWDGHVERTE